MAVRVTAAAIGCLSLVWAAIGLYIVRLALEPRGEPDDAAILFVPILATAVLGLFLSARTQRRDSGGGRLDAVSPPRLIDVACR